MNWQDKLVTLIAAYNQGDLEVRIWFSYNPPLDPESAEALLRELEQERYLEPEIAPFLQSLRDFYRLTNGITIAVGPTVFGLGLDTNSSDQLGNVNKEFLAVVQEKSNDLMQEGLAGTHAPVRIIFGSDEAGDFICLADNGSVIRVGHDSSDVNVLAGSVDDFLNHFCLGSGYIRYYDAEEDNPWVSILRKFDFL